MKYTKENFSSVEGLRDSMQEELELDSGFDLHQKAAGDVEMIRLADKYIVGLLQYDNDAQDFFENDEGAGKFIEFRSSSHAQETMEKLSKGNSLFYLVNKYAHGNVHYSISGTKTYPDEQWDVSRGCGVFIPCDYIQKEFKKMKKSHGEGEAYEHFIKDSNSVLNSYSDWCNGEVYGYSVIILDKDGHEIDCDECWGFIGFEHAQEEKNRVMDYYVKKFEIDELMPNVNIETLTAKDIKLPFRIAKKGLIEAKVAQVYDTYVVGAKYDGEDNVVVYNWSEGQEKATKAKFEQWQKNHGTTAEQFLSARMNSDIREVISKYLDKEVSKDNKAALVN